MNCKPSKSVTKVFPFIYCVSLPLLLNLWSLGQAVEINEFLKDCWLLRYWSRCTLLYFMCWMLTIPSKRILVNCDSGCLLRLGTAFSWLNRRLQVMRSAEHENEKESWGIARGRVICRYVIVFYTAELNLCLLCVCNEVNFTTLLSFFIDLFWGLHKWQRCFVISIRLIMMLLELNPSLDEK